MKYKDIFLDFDDTLYDTRGNAIISLSELFYQFELGQYFKDPQVFYDAYWNANVMLWSEYAQGDISREFLIIERFRRPLAEGICADGSHFDPSPEFCLQISDAFLDLCATKPGTIEGAKELVEYLKNKGYRLHICSNGFHEVQYRKLKSCGLLDYFDSINLSEDAGSNKPSAKFFDYACKQSGADKKCTVMIGDNYITDILGAKNYGLDTIFYNGHPENFISPGEATHEITHLLDIKNIL